MVLIGWRGGRNLRRCAEGRQRGAFRDISQRDERRQWEAWGISVRRLRDIPRGVRAWLWARLEGFVGLYWKVGCA